MSLKFEQLDVPLYFEFKESGYSDKEIAKLTNVSYGKIRYFKMRNNIEKVSKEDYEILTVYDKDDEFVMQGTRKEIAKHMGWKPSTVSRYKTTIKNRDKLPYTIVLAREEAEVIHEEYKKIKRESEEK